SGRKVAIAIHTATATTMTRAAIDAMCARTIDCRCDTSIDGITKYQCPRIIAVHAPPRSSADVRKLAMVSALPVAATLREISSPCRTTATIPVAAAAPRIAVRNLVNIRPIVAHANTVRAVHAISGSTDGAADTWIDPSAVAARTDSK